MNQEQDSKLEDSMARLNASGLANELAVKGSGRFTEKKLPPSIADAGEELKGDSAEDIKYFTGKLLPENFNPEIFENLGRAKWAMETALKSEPGSDTQKLLIDQVNILLKDSGIQQLTEENLDIILEKVKSYLDYRY